MGCFPSKKREVYDLHPNVFRVVNIDEAGTELCSGQLEITETEIILYREGRDTTVWPLHSLRRYGFDTEIFSFESGRRCDTGEGIFAFKCSRAPLLFHRLHGFIKLRRYATPYPATELSSPLPQDRQTLQASVVHRSSVYNVVDLRNVDQTPRSQSSTDILEVMPLYPQSRTNGNHVTNIYQLQDFKRENNNNQSETISEVRHEYTNDLNKDLAKLRTTLRRETAINTMRDIEDETRFLESQLITECEPNKEDNNPMSPTVSTSSEHYAQLCIDQQDGPQPYVNIVSTETSVQEANKTDVVPTASLTPKQVDYCNLATTPKVLDANAYANLLMNDKVESAKCILLNSSEHNPKFSESDTLTSMSPVEELEVNYAVLDIEIQKSIKESSSLENLSYNSSKNESTVSHTSQPLGILISQNSTEETPTTIVPVTAPSTSIGYTTIDFHKTVALTSVAASTDANGCLSKSKP
ncbi:uncharacterized protein [Epargyreus clarus]|uniref:uncharacterized protein isoform X2 n=1 Tax=Epargyreus clarus TaxID=520877 RepID=UPI003C2CA8AB